MSVDNIYKDYDKDIEFLTIPEELENLIVQNRKNGYVSPYAFNDKNVVRRYDKEHDRATIMRPAFDRDIEKIMYVPAYNRYNDKTQVFSFLHNDDISRRGLHVQYVSKIARNIGEILGLNTRLIEAIAIGHDIGHTPFGHAGESFLNQVYHQHTGRYFYHNLHSVRVLDKLYHRNLSLQTLDGILCHNGELEMKKISIGSLNNFDEFDEIVEKCYVDNNLIEKLVSSTLEGCLVRMADIIAYIGKDRIDALLIGAIDSLDMFDTKVMGRLNTTIINNLSVDLITNSYGKPYICLSDEMFEDLSIGKNQNYEFICKKESMTYSDKLKLLDKFEKMYDKCIEHLNSKDEKMPIFKHHVIPLVRNSNSYTMEEYLSEDHNLIVVDYIASMTDGYFMMLYNQLFPDEADELTIPFRGYFQI